KIALQAGEIAGVARQSPNFRRILINTFSICVACHTRGIPALGNFLTLWCSEWRGMPGPKSAEI
ncbi:hypothetical protein HAX54_018368, partial [Datura stramonium]|nr:hypothetical protein [Datura stramonium]